MKKFDKFLPFLAICSATLLLYAPIISRPNLLVERGNDLGEFFWPVFYFVKQQILENHTLPLWNNLFLSGTPLLPDPQSPLFYPPNIIFLILPIDSAFIASFMLHSFFAGIGAYLAARKGFGLSQAASIVTTLLYIAFPRTAGFLEAGHFGLVATTTWLPFLLLASVKLIKTPRFGWSVLLAVSLAGLFFTHPTTFITAAAFVFTALFIAGIYFLIKRHSSKTLMFLITGILITFGSTAITLLPQLEWLPQTTRFTLLEDRDVYPKWDSKVEFIQAIYPHVFGGDQFVNNLDTEKWLALGIFISLLALIGFLQLRNKLKLLIIVTVFGVVLIALNNASPIHSLLLSSDWYVLGRVSTRIWFIIALITVFLAGFGFEILRRKGLQKVALVLVILAVSELLMLSWVRIQKPVSTQKEYAPASVYEFLKKDKQSLTLQAKEKFRVFCVNRCFSQKESAKYGLELVEGYNTLQQMNYFKHSWQLMGGYWNYYTLALPPIGAHKFTQLQPDATSLGEFNTKYVISPYKLKDKNFKPEKEINGYMVYRNAAFLSRAYFQTDDQKPSSEAPILLYTPNYIRIDTSGQITKRLVLSEVWSPGWKAYLNGKEAVTVQEKPNTLRLVDIKNDTQFVDFTYDPESFRVGRLITSITILSLVGLGILQLYILKIVHH